MQQHRANNEVGSFKVLEQGFGSGLKEDQRWRNISFELCRFAAISPAEKHLRAHPVRCPGCMLPHYAITNNDDFAVACTQDSAKLHAFAMVELRQVVAADR